MTLYRQPKYHWFSTTTHEIETALTFEIDATEKAIIDLIKALKNRGK